jgi:hypothetical protein|tara:strand:+ start:5071 stop:5670 length:600 start_codon:yes stop_codon:yes gene_type:complete
MKTSEQINEIAEALAAAQGEIQNPGKSAENPFFKSKYADLAEVLSVVRPVFSRHGLSVVQMPYSSDDGGIGVTTMISHKSGQWMQGSLELPLQVAKNVNQDAGSAITYMRRYALAAAAGVAQEDLDANLGAENTGKVTNLKVISKAKAAEITGLIDLTGSDLVGFLNFCHAESVETIPANKYEKAHDALIAKLEKTNAS